MPGTQGLPEARARARGSGAGPLTGPRLPSRGLRREAHPTATARDTARRLGARLEVMPQMSHWLIGEPGWEAVADRCLAWLSGQAAPLAAE